MSSGLKPLTLIWESLIQILGLQTHDQGSPMCNMTSSLIYDFICILCCILALLVGLFSCFSPVSQSRSMFVRPCQCVTWVFLLLQEMAADLEGLLRVWSSVQPVWLPAIPPLVRRSRLNIFISPDSGGSVTSSQQRAAVTVSKLP